MSSKLLYSLSDDNNPKQMGCINGLLHHFLTSRSPHPINHNTLPPPPPPHHIHGVKLQPHTKEHKDPDPQPHQLSIKTARNHQNPTNHTDSPRPLHQSKSRIDSAHTRRFSFDAKESTKETSLKLNELPRLSLDSRQGKLLQQDEPVSHRQVSTILTKLMGLEDMSQSTPARSAKSEDESETSVSIYKEIDKRVADLDFTKAGKDLRALKHILDAMQRTSPRVEIEASSFSCDSIKTVEDPSPRKSSNPGKAMRNQSKGGSYQMPSNLPRVRTGQSAKPDAKVSSPRTQQKNQKIEKFSQERRSRSNQAQRNNSAKKKVQSSSKKMEVRSKKGVQRKLELDEHLDIVHTPRPPQKLSKSVGHGLNVIEEPAAPLKEQPSPVSVLDADFYGDESPSPVKKKATVFRDDYSAAEDGNQLSSIRRTCFAADNMEKANKESPDSMWMKRALCTDRSQVRAKASYPSMERENEHTARVIATDLAKRSESWTDFTCENSWLVLDIERLIFKDLIVEIVHDEASR